MPPLPSGTVTFVFTDIEGSTRLLQELGDAYAGVARDHRQIVREAFRRPRRHGDRHAGGQLLLLIRAGA